MKWVLVVTAPDGTVSVVGPFRNRREANWYAIDRLPDMDSVAVEMEKP